MSYEPLHHKYRPKTFADLVGQEAIATTLSNALRLNKIAPAYLFAGPRGTGKTSSARILAKSLNCLQQDTPTDRPCGVCDVCRSITNGSSLDIIEIDAASNTGVDNIRELIERSQFAPVQCRHKVYIIDECLAGDTLVVTSEGLRRIDDPTIQGTEALSYNALSGDWQFKPVVRWFDQGTRQTLTIQTTHQELRCTANHLIRTETGWIAAENLQPGMQIVSPDLEMMGESLSKKRLTLEHAIDRIAEKPTHDSLTFNPKKNLVEQPQNPRSNSICRVGLRLPTLPVGSVRKSCLETVHSIKEGSLEKVYDIEVQDHHNFVANGLNVHNCHSLSTSSFNALLKTLEEPPPRVVFVLATTDPQRVLPTIISRCQRFDFRRIPLDAMVQHLHYIAEQETIQIRPDALLTVAQIAQGGLRDAQSMLDQLSLLSGEIAIDKVWDLVGAVPEQDSIGLLLAIASDRPEAVLDRTRAIMDRGREPLIVLQNLTSFYRDLLIAKTAGDRADLVAMTSATWQQLREFAQTQEISLILQGQQHLRACEAQIKNTTQPRLWLEVALLGLLPSALRVTTEAIATPRTASANPTRDRSVASIAPPPERQTQPPSQPPSQQPSSQTPPGSQNPQPTHVQPNAVQTRQSEPVPTVSTPVDAQPPGANSPTAANLESLWQQVLSHLPNSIKSLLSQQGTLMDVGEHDVRLGFRSPPLMKLAANERKLPQIKAAFGQVLGRPIQVQLEVYKKNTPPASQTSQASQLQHSTSVQSSVQSAVQSQRFTNTQTQSSQTQSSQRIQRQPSQTQTVTATTTKLTPVSKVSPSSPTQNLPSQTAQPVQASRNVQAIAPPETISQTRENRAGVEPMPPLKPATMTYVDESEAIAAAQKLAKMFGGTVVEDFEDSDRFDWGSTAPTHPTTLDGSNRVEQLSDLTEEMEQEAIAPSTRSEQATPERSEPATPERSEPAIPERSEPATPEISEQTIPEPAIVEQAIPEQAIPEQAIVEQATPEIPEPAIVEPIPLSEHQPPTENLLPAAEEEELLRGLIGEEYGNLAF